MHNLILLFLIPIGSILGASIDKPTQDNSKDINILKMSINAVKIIDGKKNINNHQKKSNLNYNLISNDRIKWDIIDSQNTRNQSPLIWEKIKEEDFDLDLYKETEPKKPINIKEGLYTLWDINYREQIDASLLKIGNAIPTANTLKEGDLKISFGQISPIKAGYAGGTGNQNYLGLIDYGITDKITISGFYTHSDDPLHKKINNLDVQPSNLWVSYGAELKLKTKLSENVNIALQGSIEKWDVKSGGCNLYRCTSKSNNIFNSSKNEVKNSNLIGSLSSPITWNITNPLEITLVPKAVFLPDKQGNNDGEGSFYGNNFGIGLGIAYKPLPKLKSFSSVYLPIAGENSFDENLNFKKVGIYTTGIRYSLDPRITFESYISNGFGKTSSTGILSIPSANDVLYGGRIIYTPTNVASRKIKRKYENLNVFSGLSVSSPSIINTGKRRIRSSLNGMGSWWNRLDINVSNLFSFDFSVNTVNQNSQNTNVLSTKYHNPYEAMARAGGTALLFSQDRGDFLTSSFRLSAGRARGWGWLFAESLNSYEINNHLKMNLNPKYAWSGFGDAASLGASLNIVLTPGIVFIPETNIPLKESDQNWTIAIRFIPFKNKHIDIYTTNSLSFMDIGQFFKSEDQSFGLSVGSIF